VLLEDKYSGPYQIGSYFLPIILIIIPNLLLMGSIMFALATLTRKMTATYLAGVAFLAVYAIIGVQLHRMDNEILKVLLDPFGITALTVYSKYWTVSDMNNFLMPINVVFLVNRIIWLTAGIIVLWYTYHKFKFIAFLEKKKKRLAIISDKTELVDYDQNPPEISLQTTKFFTFSQCVTISWKDFKRIILHPAFIILTILALSEIIANFRGGLGNQSGRIYPFTSWYLKQTMHIWIYMLPMTIFFGGMLVWK